MRYAWHLVTGEYPPAPGGVSDYTQRLARALAREGEQVHVWTSGDPGCATDSGVRVHRVAEAFTPGGLWRLSRALDQEAAPRRLVVQYSPHAFGMRAMNSAVPAFLAARRQDAVWVMFHEVAYPWGGPLRHRVLAAVTRLNSALIARRASRVFVSTESWSPMVRRLGAKRPTTLPVPSNLPESIDPDSVLKVRRALGEGPLVGHFSTYGELIAPLLRDVLAPLLSADPGRRVLLVGRGAGAFAAALRASDARLSDRLLVRGELPAADLAEHLAACDVLVQPYPDGVTTRRSTIMAPLALGRPVVTNRGHLTESTWDDLEGVALVASPMDIAPRADALLRELVERDRLGAAAARLYRGRFSLEHTVRTLLETAREEEAG